MAFLLLSTSISQCFPPTIPQDITSLPLQVIILPFAIIHVAKSSQFHTERCSCTLATEASFPLWPIRGNKYNQYKLFTHKSDFSNAEGKISKTDLSFMFFLGHRICTVTSMFSFIYNYTRVSTLSVKPAYH